MKKIIVILFFIFGFRQSYAQTEDLNFKITSVYKSGDLYWVYVQYETPQDTSTRVWIDYYKLGLPDSRKVTTDLSVVNGENMMAFKLQDLSSGVYALRVAVYKNGSNYYPKKSDDRVICVK